MLVDTSVWIDFLNGHDSPEAELLAAVIAYGGAIEVPGIVLTEVLLGLRDEQQARKVASLLEAFDEPSESDRADYLEAARIYRTCRAHGHTVRSTIDCLIAQTCLRNGLSLLTRDRDFRAIAEVTALELVHA